MNIELVLLPGLDGTGDLFDGLRGHLPQNYQVTVCRYPNDPSLTYDGYVEYSKGLVGSRPTFLLGESFSGPVAVKLAYQLQEQVRGLILAATFLASPWPSLLVSTAAGVDPRRAPRTTRDAVLMGRYRDAHLSAQLDSILADLPSPVGNARLRAVAGIDVRLEFERLTCPILALHGSKDWLVPGRAMRAAIKSKPTAEFASFPAAHMLLQTCPDLVARKISQFVDRIAEAA